MAMLSSRFPPPVESDQVWDQLDRHLRQQTISVVAQMAFNLVKTHAASSQQEIDDEYATAREQAAQ
jgi:hypothetical protein